MVFDSWYGSLENLKLIRGVSWVWLTQMKGNRLVNPDRSGLRPVARVETDAGGTLVHLKGYGPIRLFKIVAPDGDSEWWVSNDLRMSPLTFLIWIFRERLQRERRGLSRKIQMNSMRLPPSKFCTA